MAGGRRPVAGGGGGVRDRRGGAERRGRCGDERAVQRGADAGGAGCRGRVAAGRGAHPVRSGGAGDARRRRRPVRGHAAGIGGGRLHEPARRRNDHPDARHLPADHAPGDAGDRAQHRRRLRGVGRRAHRHPGVAPRHQVVQRRPVHRRRPDVRDGRHEVGRPRRSRLARRRDAHHRGQHHQDRRPRHAVPHVADRLRGHSRLDHLEGRQLRAVRAEQLSQEVAHPLQRGRPETGRGGGLRHLGRGAGGALGHYPRRRPGDSHHDAVDREGDQRPGRALGAQSLLLEGGPGRASSCPTSTASSPPRAPTPRCST